MANESQGQKSLTVTKPKTSRLGEAADVAIREVLGVRAGEEILILTNPECDAFRVSKALFDAALAAGGKPVMVVQERKTPFDFASRLFVEAVKAGPDVLITCNDHFTGRDAFGENVGYTGRDGRKYDHIAFKSVMGDRQMRWLITGQPGIVHLFLRCVTIDYDALRTAARKLKNVLDMARDVRVTTPAGTDVRLSLAGRMAHLDDGDVRSGGSVGNLPCGEIFYSPAPGSCQGTLVFDGAIVLENGCVLPDQPVKATVVDGYVTGIEGGETAERLLDVLRKGEQAAKDRGLTAEAQNAWNIGELGIGLNPEAQVSGNLLEAEKAFRTIHFAIGMNVDGDASAPVHQDCLVLKPSLWVDGNLIMKDGDLLL